MRWHASFFPCIFVFSILLCPTPFGTPQTDEVASDSTERRDSLAAPVLELEPKVVTGSRRHTPLKESADLTLVVTRQELEAIHARNAGEAMTYLPGVSQENGTGSGLPFRTTSSINGMPVHHTLVLVDGARTLSEHIHTGVNLDLIPAGEIERVEVVKGPGSSLYGSEALGGVINIITREPTEETELRLRGATASRGGRTLGLSLSGTPAPGVRHVLYQNWETSDGPAITAPAHRLGVFGHERLDLMDKVEWDLPSGFSARAQVRYYRGTTQSLNRATGGSLDDETFLFAPQGGLAWAPEKSPWSAQMNYAYSLWDAEKNGESHAVYSPMATLTYDGIAGHSLLFGGEWNRRSFQRSKVEEGEQSLYALFAQDEWRMLATVKLLSTLRLDKVENLDPVLAPKLALLWTAFPDLRLRVSAGSGFRAPTVQELHEEGYGHGTYLRDGNPSLKPEYSINLTGGIEWSPRRSYTLALNAYHNTIEDMIALVHDRDTAQFAVYRRQNFQRVVTRGIEATARLRPWEPLRLDVGGSILHAASESASHDVPYYPGQKVFARLIGLKPLSPSWMLSGFAGMNHVRDRHVWHYQNGQVEELEDYVRVDAGLGLEVRNRLQIQLTARNLLGEPIEQHDDLTMRLKGEPEFETSVSWTAF